MDTSNFLKFASEADIAALWGVGFLVLAGLAFWAERRTGKRADINRVGWVPWMFIGIACAVIGGGLISVALPAVLGS